MTSGRRTAGRGQHSKHLGEGALVGTLSSWQRASRIPTRALLQSHTAKTAAVRGCSHCHESVGRGRAACPERPASTSHAKHDGTLIPRPPSRTSVSSRPSISRPYYEHTSSMISCCSAARQTPSPRQSTLCRRQTIPPAAAPPLTTTDRYRASDHPWLAHDMAPIARCPALPACHAGLSGLLRPLLALLVVFV